MIPPHCHSCRLAGVLLHGLLRPLCTRCWVAERLAVRLVARGAA